MHPGQGAALTSEEGWEMVLVCGAKADPASHAR